jgi:ABC-type Fe3+ transport system permease subunit
MVVAVAYQVMLNRIGRVATVKGQGRAVQRRERRRVDWVLSFGLFVTLSVTLVAPLAMLVAGSFTKIFGLFDLKPPRFPADTRQGA